MTPLNRDDWYDISHDLDWTLSYVEEQDAFPVEWSGTAGVPKEAWRSWEEPFRVSYRDYVMVQRGKEAGVAGVRDALKRAHIYEKLDPAFAAVSHFHMGALCMVEQLAVTMLGRFVRFAPSPRWRNLSAFGMLDEIRHAQLHLLFSRSGPWSKMEIVRPRFSKASVPWCKKPNRAWTRWTSMMLLTRCSYSRAANFKLKTFWFAPI